MIAQGYRIGSNAIRTLTTAFVLLVMVASGSVEAKDRKLLISSFEDIVIEGNLVINLVTGKPPSALASGDRGAIDSLSLRQSDNTLTLLQKTSNTENSRSRDGAPLTITITNRAVRNITVRGNGQVQVNGMRQAGNARIQILGNGKVTIDSIAVGNLDVSISGNGLVALTAGTVREARVTIDGSGSYLAPQMQNRNLILSQNGGAETKANVVDHADIVNDGAGTITITGKGKCSIARRGTGTINCMNYDKSN
jgi:Putative auto-transporter adhesin, head GIN domain